MFDTTVTIVGNALNAPELRRTSGTNTLVASFRVASTSRRYDRDSGRWVDGPSLRVRVNCWRRLAEGVTQSVVTGDPLVVTGRMFTRDWVGEDGQHRVSYELEAIAVGHDLSRGFAKFSRHRPAGLTTAVEDAESDARIAGEPTVPAGSPISEPERQRGDFGDPHRPDGPTPTFDPPPMTDSYADFDPAGADSEGAQSEGAQSEGAQSEGGDSEGAEQVEEEAEPSARRRGRSRVPVPA
ncbi:MAG: single-strand binding protein [Dactylosporangium sp.]|nr:single-strand binding protein [Dactylosporangium sp.]